MEETTFSEIVQNLPVYRKVEVIIVAGGGGVCNIITPSFSGHITRSVIGL